MFALYTTPLSANGRKVLAVAHDLGLEPEIHRVNVYEGEGRTPEYLAVNPSGKIPTLVDGDLVLSESNAILQYMSEAYGDFRLWSRDARVRASIARWLFWEASQWQPGLIPLLSGFVGRQVVPALASTSPVAVDWNDAAFRTLAGLLETHLEDTPFLVGEGRTLADFSVAGMMTYARPAGFPFEGFPAILRWYEGVEDTEAWQETAAGPWAQIGGKGL